MTDLVQDQVDAGPLATIGTDEVMSVLNNEQPKAAPSPAPTPTPAPAVGTPSPAPAAPQAPASASPTPTPATAPTEVEQLRLEVARLQGQVSARPAAPAAPQNEVPFEERLPDHQYKFPIPDQLMTMLNSDDPGAQKQAIGTMLQAVAIAAHKNVVTQMTKFFREEVTNTIQHSIQASRVSEKVYNDFYGKNPDLNDPRLYGFITQTAQAMFQQNPGLFAQGWNDNVAQALEQQVRTLLNRPRTPAAAPAAPVAPAVMMPGAGARPAAPRAPTQADDIAATLFSGEF